MLSRLSKWWSRKTAQWMGVTPHFEDTHPDIHRVRALASRLGLDSGRVIQLLRPQYHFVTSGKYGPVNHLLPNRLGVAMKRHADLPFELHQLAVHSEESRAALLCAVHAYAVHTAPSFPHDVLTERDREKTPDESARDLVWDAVSRTCSRLNLYLESRNVQSPLVSELVDEFTLAKKVYNEAYRNRPIGLPFVPPARILPKLFQPPVQEPKSVSATISDFDVRSGRRHPKKKSRRPGRKR